MSQGSVTAIYIAPESSAPMQRVDAVNAIAGRGLEGDRYADEKGTFSTGEPHQHVTLIESEALDRARTDYEIDFEDHEPRRNIVTKGIALTHLVGSEFDIGDARFRAIRLSEPCGHVDKLAEKPLCKTLVHRCGLQCEVISGGAIAVGAKVG